MSASESEVARYQKKEAYNHELVTSEDFYVSEMEALVTHIVTPLQANASRCNIKSEEVDFVFNIIEHIVQFHIQFLRIIRDELSCINTFGTYIGFITMYIDYFKKYNRIINIVSGWSFSMEFREFILLRLQNEKCRKYIDHRLCSIPWYLYRPFERIKQYYRFFKDLEIICNNTDIEYKLLIGCKKKIKSLYDKIKRSDSHYMKKTRLLEIQLQIFGNIEPIVNNHRYFVYNRMCQMKLNGTITKKTKKYKHIHLYIFNDQLLWCSKRGQFKRSFKFINTNLVYGIPDNSTVNDPMLFIQYASSNEYKKYKKHRKSNNKLKKIKKNSNKIIESKESIVDEYNNLIINHLEINYGKPTRKILILFVNESVRNQCLEKIKETQSKYTRYLQKKREKKYLLSHTHSGNSKHSKHRSRNTSIEQSMTFSRTNTEMTEDSSFAMDPININNNIMKPLEIHHQKYASQLSTPTNTSQITITINESDDTDNDLIETYSDNTYFEKNNISTENSIEKNGNINNCNINNGNGNGNGNGLKQSVSTEIHTIQEEDEDDVKCEHE